MRYGSIFDIVGPSMIGPSSSHTAGAARIGLMARKIFHEQPEKIKVIFYGSFAKTYLGHGTDLAIIGGLLGYETDDQRIVNSLETATKLGIIIELITSEEATDHPNTAKIIMQKKNRVMEVTGISPGGGRATITEFNGFKVNTSDESNFLLVLHQDRYGVIASVANLLAAHQINIAQMEVARKSKGAEALMVICTDQPIFSELSSEMKKLDLIMNVIIFNLNEPSQP